MGLLHWLGGQSGRGKYLARAADPDVLNHAWRRLRNEPGLWTRGVPMARMNQDVVRHIGELARELREGRYRAQPMRCFEIPKAEGGKRLIAAPLIRDKLAQRAVLTVLEPLGEAIFDDASFGFRPRCTREMALSRIREWVRRGWCWLGDADIETCFDSIPHRPALKKLEQLCADPAIVDLVRQWLDALPAHHRPAPGRGFPQGMVLSPFLCNLYLHQLDLDLNRQGIPFVRFADDFVLLARDQQGAQQALRQAGRSLQRLGLKLHPTKSRVIRSSTRHRFLGQRLPDSRERFTP